jgi:hypothetical protein
MKQQEEQLKMILDPLERQWARTKVMWNDPVGQRFERQYMKPLLASIDGTNRSLLNLMGVIDRIRRQVR